VLGGRLGTVPGDSDLLGNLGNVKCQAETVYMRQASKHHTTCLGKLTMWGDEKMLKYLGEARTWFTKGLLQAYKTEDSLKSALKCRGK
jgi:hypothetical protein